MKVFQHPHWGILLVPNKCASSSCQRMIPKQYHKENINDVTLKNNLIWGIVRDPVEWYVSGWRFFRTGLLPDKSNKPYVKDFDTHLTYCFSISQNYKKNKKQNSPSVFDTHTWYNPYQQNIDIYNHIDKIIKLENQKRFNQVIGFFSDGGLQGVRKNVNNEEKAKRRGIEYIPRPKLTDRSIELLHSLDDWSHKAGYNLNQSIEKYINTLCY